VDDSLGALRVAYDDLAALAASLGEEDCWLPTGCRGWVVRDLVLHLLSDAQRGLVALATPAEGPPDRDAVTYWVDAPTGDDPEFRHVRGTRTIASAYGLRPLVTAYVETSRAVVSLAQRTDPRACVPTQGHTLLAQDLVATLAVEAAVHHLDLVTDLDRRGPGERPLALVRQTLDGLLGRPVPVGWDDTTYALSGTGRRPLTAEEGAALGDDVARFPLLS
jgi:hypothetical protein